MTVRCGDISANSLHCNKFVGLQMH